MHFGRGQAPDLAVEDELGSHVLEQVDSFKDLGVLHSPDMKHHEQVDAAVAKARSAAYLIRRAFTGSVSEGIHCLSEASALELQSGLVHD